MSAGLAQSLARHHAIKIPHHYLSDAGYEWESFDQFLEAYDQVGRVIRRAADIERVVFEYLNSVALVGTIYCEFMLSPDHSVQNGIPISDQLDAVEAGIGRAREKARVHASLIVTAVRHQGPEKALALAETVAELDHPVVVGFGLTGNERVFGATEFVASYEIATQAGLGRTAHAGEWLPAPTIRETVAALNLTRVGHGITAVSDASVLEDMIQGGIGFEVCVSSNYALGAVLRDQLHPVGRLIDSGARVAICTDDPAFFRTTPDREIRVARELGGAKGFDYAKILRDSVDMAFCDERVKGELRKRISESYR